MKLIALLLAVLPGIIVAAEPLAPATVPQGLAASDWSSIRAAYEAGRHAARRQDDGTLAARNPGQQWRTEFDGKGFLVTPDHGQWTWGLELTGYGERNLLSASSSSLTHEGGKITCPRDENLTEWFNNDTRGLEQGWTLHSSERGTKKERGAGVPPVSSNLTLYLALRGNLNPQVSPDGTTVTFQTDSGTTALTYGGLKAWDADGKNLPVRFDDAVENAIRIAVEDQNARYPITIDPIAQQAYLKAGNTGSFDYFGFSVAVSGNTVVVGAVGEDSSTTGVNSTPNENAPSSGAAYVFVRNGGTWSQQAYLKASNPGEDSFGNSVAVSGDTLVVGAKVTGGAYVFVRNGSTWSQQASLAALNSGGDDQFGISVAVSGETIVIGADREDSSTTGVNSMPNENAGDSGAAYVFTRSGNTWSQQAYLKASNTGIVDLFGSSVAISGDTVVVGAIGEASSSSGVNSTPNESAAYSGAAYVFGRTGGTWNQQAYLKTSSPERDDFFGNSVAVSGDTVVIGAPYEPGYSGSAYVFIRSGVTWSPQGHLKASNFGANDAFGTSVAVSGDTIVVGAVGEDSSASGVNSTPDESATGSGAAYVFGRSSGTWSQRFFLKASNTGVQDSFGNSVAVSGDTIVAGAPSEDSSNTGVNSSPSESAGNSGAAYVFTDFGVISVPGITITGTAKNGLSFSIDFRSAAGLSGWRVRGSSTLQGFPDDLTTSTTFAELTPGNYRAVVDLTNAPGLKYFMRVER